MDVVIDNKALKQIGAISQAQDPKKLKPSNSSVSAIFVFGDSTVDPGNNNYLPTVFRSDFPPYGRDFLQHRPTGRFSNGRLVTDFVASYLGLKEEIPPYLDIELSEEDLMTGVSFASAGTGYDPLTPSISKVIPIPNQLDYFGEYLEMLQPRIGMKRTQDLIRRAAVVISAGTNDFLVNYFALPFQKQKYTVEQYQHFLLLKLADFLQEVQNLGFRKIVVVGLPPIGCLPIVITLNSHNGFQIQKRGCIDTYNTVASDYNYKLRSMLATLQMSARNGVRIAYADIYQPLIDMVERPAKFGFEESTNGCCGTGLFEASFLCNPKSLACPDASKFVFFDSIHPTEKTYYYVFKSLRKTIDDLLKD
ncbi:hypothetical protein MRB53_035799 [Persea americana]|uniref:Uncharacterized protein n=1 Tax=Persea americana TaxID=3435 RepID=A0ACC2K649_PERAE|nr:hypothetical protein MRB53_035799 [Persea americana]